MEQQQVDPEVLKHVENVESKRFNDWMQSQTNSYLNSRVIELAVRVGELEKERNGLLSILSELTPSQAVNPEDLAPVEAEVVESSGDA